MAAAVELRGVSKKFGGFTALHETSLSVEEGEFMTFLGPSGCGKTTCLRLISGFEYPTTGEVWIGGQNVTDVPPYRRDANQVFQSYALFPHLTIRENIAFGLRMKRLPPTEIKTRVERVVEMTSLGDVVDRRPDSLSGGQRQRAALARAIVCEPKVLLLDEPLSALDAKLRAQMRLELKRLQKRLGITFIFVTHDQEEALTMSDRIAVLSAGRLEQVGTVNEIYYRPATRFVATFIGETNIVEAEILASRDGLLTCRLEGGLVLDVQAPEAPPREAKVLLSLRPERIRLVEPAATGTNIFSGVVAQEVFKGAVDELTIAVEGGLELGVMLPNDGGRGPDPHEGESVRCAIDPADINIVTS